MESQARGSRSRNPAAATACLSVAAECWELIRPCTKTGKHSPQTPSGAPVDSPAQTSTSGLALQRYCQPGLHNDAWLMQVTPMDAEAR
jgi:hypothetical protein